MGPAQKAGWVSLVHWGLIGDLKDIQEPALNRQEESILVKENGKCEGSAEGKRHGGLRKGGIVMLDGVGEGELCNGCHVSTGNQTEFLQGAMKATLGGWAGE